ncbi:uncharacterized protein B0H64DRAFT_211682 [Chaetomium fimeti]|uniref:C2H2-type domain-containing protein n=1 Tax=Chaetomium fimeti TaxID=1854472 RepID=A0AAE0LQQ4_9PEZI|nr:hypothetical protein B0H64DRAFT_211682 [Chaetomium fimeti]
MKGSSTPADPASLCESFLECVEAFKKLILALNREDCRVIHLEQVSLTEILEHYGRVKLWGHQSKADLPAGARGSLDDVMRHDDDLKELTRGFFMRMRGHLAEAMLIAEKKHDPEAGSDYDSVSSVSSDADSDSGAGEGVSRSTPRICFLVRGIAGVIRSLYDLSSLLRRPKITEKYVRSVNSKLDKLTSRDSDTLPLSVGFRASDEDHVIEKVLQWRGLTKAEKRFDFEEEEAAPTENAPISDGVEDILWFCQRLARANTRRREQLQYWAAHPYDASKDLAQAPVEQVREAQESRSQTSTLKPPDPNLPRPGPRSAVSKQSFSTAPVSLIHDTKTNVRPRTVYSPTAVGKSRSNSVPDPPKASNDSGTFPCPYCGMPLEYKEMENRQTWQRHVFHDLRPYVCTFEDCQNAGKLYVSRHDWMYHELQVHRREYVCKECDKKFQKRQEASEHHREHYGESIPAPRLNVIVDLSERQADISLGEKEPCIICGEELSPMALQGHVASHMEDVALFVLPNSDEDKEAGGSEASVQVAKLESRGNTTDLTADSGSLGFSAAGDNEPNPLDFARILVDDEMGYASKISSWEAKKDQSPISNARCMTVEVDYLNRETSSGISSDRDYQVPGSPPFEVLDRHIKPERDYRYPPPPQAPSYDPATLYPEPTYGRSSPSAPVDERPSNLSSAPAVSSAVGLPQSNHDQLAQFPGWAAPQTMNVSPNIVGHAEYLGATEYGTAFPGMEEYGAFDFGGGKPPRFVGELESVSTRVPVFPQRASLSSASGVLFLSPSTPNASHSPPLTSAAEWDVSPQTPQSFSKGFVPQNGTSFAAPLQSSCSLSLSRAVTSSLPKAPETRLTGPTDTSLIHPDISRPVPTPFDNGFQPQLFNPYPAPLDASSRRPSHPFEASPSYGDAATAFSGDEAKEKSRCPYPDCGKSFKDLKAHMLTHQTGRPEKCPIATCEYHVKGFAREYDRKRHTLTHYKGTMVCGFCPGSLSAAEKSYNRADVFKRHLTAVHGVDLTPPNSRKEPPAGIRKRLPGRYAADATGKCSICSQTFANAQGFYEHLDDCVLRIVLQEDPAEAINARNLSSMENDIDVRRTLEKNNVAEDDIMLSTEHEVRVTLGDDGAYVGGSKEEKGASVSDDPTEEEVRAMRETLEKDA